MLLAPCSLLTIFIGGEIMKNEELTPFGTSQSAASHTGHRERLCGRFIDSGLDTFSDVNVLELLLFYAIPRKDTVPLAKELLNRFGSLSAVFDAPIDELLKVPGIGERTATLIKFIPSLSGEYYISRNKDSATVLCRHEAVDVLRPFYTDFSTEFAVMVLLDASGKILGSTRLKHGSTDSTTLDTDEILSEIKAKKPSGVLFSHCHTKGLAAPSQNDIVSTERLADFLASHNIKLCDHIIFARDDVFCMSCMKTRIRQGIFAFDE